MRISLMTSGTRGDVVPFIALGARLADRDHDVAVALDGEYAPHAEAAGLRVVPIPMSLTRHIESPDGQHLLRKAPIPLMRGMQAWYREHQDVLGQAASDVASGAEALVGQHFSGEVMQALADQAGVPYAHVYPWPYITTSEIAPFSLTTRRIASGRLCRASYGLSERARFAKAERVGADAFRERLGLAPSASAWVRQNRPGGLVLAAFSEALVKRPADWGPQIVQTGDWHLPAALRERIDEDIDGDLDAWLRAGDRPLYIGLGSMPVLEPGRLMRTVADVTRTLGVRALVAGRGLDQTSLPPHIRVQTASVDHERLLPRCRAAVHHGGAGTTHASLRAGLPTMVCSVWGDQPFWGALAMRSGLGYHVPFAKLDVDSLEAGLRRLLTDEVAARCAAVGARLRAEPDGATRAAGALEDWLVTASGGGWDPSASTRGLAPSRSSQA